MMTGDMANATSTAPENGRAQLDTLARLALCAALVEYDTETTGRLAEHSAIFAPYRDGTSIEDINNNVDYQEAYQGRYSTALNDEAQGSAMQLSWATGARPLSIAGSAAPTLFSDFLAGGASSGGAETTRPLSRAEELDDSDLASEWGLETVMSKFDNGNYNPSSVKPKKARPRKSFAQSEVLGPSLASPMTDSQDVVENLDLLESRSAPSRLAGFNNCKKGKGNKAKSSLETELELAFNSESDGDALSNAGGRSRASSFGMSAPSLFDFQGSTDRAEQSSAAYAREAVARPDSRMSLDFERGLLPPPANFGMEDNEDSPATTEEPSVPYESSSTGYVSRFDPKAVAAAQAEHASSRLRFPESLHPKILIMPAPLADLLREEGNPGASVQAQEEAKKAHIEREAGKLYGKSLMDELVSRKMRMKAKTRTFQGDSRRAMMDNPVSQANREKMKRAPSPLSGKMEGGDEDDDEDKPLQALAQQKLHSPDATSAKAVKDDGRDPWAKYASRRSLAALASDEPLPASPSRSLLSPEGLTPPGQGASFRQSMSTKELQQQYKHSRYLSTMSLQAIANPPAAPEESDSDDDVPLDTRRINLAEKALQSPQGKGKKQAEVQAEQPVASVFGQDLVMARELKKLEEILKIEEAEKKIEAEKQRIRDAEKEAKERKKREKMEKKQKKKGKKGKEAETEGTLPSHLIDNATQQQHTTDPRISVLHPDANGIYPDFPPGHEQNQHLREDQEELRPDQRGSNRFSALPLPGEEAEDIIWPSGAARPRSSSIAPSLDLNFLSSTKNLRLDGNDDGDHAKDSLGDWFGEKDNKSNGSQHSASDDEEEDRPVRSASRLGLTHFGHDDEEDDAKDTEDEDWRRRSAILARMPEIRTPSRADSFSGVLESFGINEGGSDSGSERGGSKPHQQTKTGVDSDSEDEEEQPISKVIARRSVAWQNTKVAFKAPQLDLGESFGVTEEDTVPAGTSANTSKRRDADDSDASSVETAPNSKDEEDDTPLGIQRVKANMAARAAQEDESDSSDDDVPLALREDDDRPLGQAHPTAIIAQQMEQQQMHNMILVQQMQMQYQNQMAMQYQAMQQVAAMQSQLGMQGGYMQAPPPPMSDMGSTVGLNLPPDPKLLSSVDRWRQNIA